jgi:hypothetical protein
MTIRDNERTLGTVLEAVITLCYPNQTLNRIDETEIAYYHPKSKLRQLI